MKSGPKRTNSDEKIIKGTDRHDRTNYNEPTPEHDIVKPDFIKKTRGANAIWDWHIAQGMGARVLTSWDSYAFGLFCCMCSELNNGVIEDKRVPFSASEITQFRMLAECFGCVPAGRPRIKERPGAKALGSGLRPGTLAHDYFKDNISKFPKG